MGSDFSLNKYEEIDVDELVSIRDNGNSLIIDVRGRNEIDRTGILPGAINIPFLELADTFAKTPYDFQKQFGKFKPKKDTVLVFSCHSGGRSEAASQLAVQLGYTKVKNFSGGWTAWENSEYVEKF